MRQEENLITMSISIVGVVFYKEQESNESTENVKDSLILTPLIQTTTKKMPTKMEQHYKK